jgi:hypothetical protein
MSRNPPRNRAAQRQGALPHWGLRRRGLSRRGVHGERRSALADGKGAHLRTVASARRRCMTFGRASPGGSGVAKEQSGLVSGPTLGFPTRVVMRGPNPPKSATTSRARELRQPTAQQHQMSADRFRAVFNGHDGGRQPGAGWARRAFRTRRQTTLDERDTRSSARAADTRNPAAGAVCDRRRWFPVCSARLVQCRNPDGRRG